MRRRRAIADAARQAGARWWSAPLIVSLAACGGIQDGNGVADPAATALRLFELARLEEPSTDRLRGTFDLEPGEGARAVLLDALAALPPQDELRVVEIVQPAGPEDAFVDLTVRLPGGGDARFSVRLHAAEPGAWRVRWFGGPGVEWPPGRGGSQVGLSTSAPPDPSR